MNALTKPLACAVALLASAFVSTGYAQTTPAPYKYSVTLGITTPKASAADLATKDKTLPAGVDFSPCNAAANMDQLAFTIKYDAGKLAADLKNVYVIFSHPDTGLTAGAKPYLALVRDKLTSDTQFKPYATAAGIQATDTYAAAASNLGYAQTEVILGGNIPLEGLSSGLWLVTAIIGDGANFDDPATWSAWDSKPFMLRKPWKGTAADTCL